MFDKKYCITSVTPTIAKCMDVALPLNSDHVVIESIIKAMQSKNISKIQKCLVFAPDAIGEVIYNKNQNLFAEIEKQSLGKVQLNSVYIPKTPVCFASMFSGAMPIIHGIKKYEKPVLEIDTIFDSLIRSQRNPAIVAVKDSSIDLIFRNREMAYFSEKYDSEVIEQTVKLLFDNKHDFILSYNQEYDDMIHQTVPDSVEAINALINQNSNFLKLVDAFDRCWLNYDRLIMYSPDHGCHFDTEIGRGNHGEDIPEDMNVIHFYGVAKAGERIRCSDY